MNSRDTTTIAAINALFLAYRADLAWTFLVGIVMYGDFVFLPGLHIDDEVSAVYHTIISNVALGRWGISLIRLVLIPEPFNGYFTSLLSVALMAAAAVVFAALLELDSFERRIAAILAVAFPEFCYQLQLHLQSDVIPVGYLLALLSFAALRAALPTQGLARAGGLLCSTALATLALSIYQPIIIIAAATCLLSTLHRLLRGAPIADLVRVVATSVVVLVAAVLLYLVTSRVVLHVSGIASAGSYFAQQFAWNKLPTARVIGDIMYVLRGGGSATYYGERLYGSVFAPASLILIWSYRLGPVRLAITLALLAAVMLSPYAIVIGLGAGQAARTFVSQGFVFAGLWAVAIALLPAFVDLASQRFAGTLAATIFVLCGTFIGSRLAFADYIQWKADTSTGTRIVDDIYHKYSGFNSAQYPVFFSGAYHRDNFWRRKNYDMFGKSFFAWDDGNTDRINTFLKVSGIANFNSPPLQQATALTAEARRLPLWPDPASISLVQGALVVHLGP